MIVIKIQFALTFYCMLHDSPGIDQSHEIFILIFVLGSIQSISTLSGLLFQSISICLKIYFPSDERFSWAAHA